MSKTTIENWTQSEEWWNVVRALNLREETVSGVDEQGIVINFINKLLTTQKEELVKEIRENLPERFKGNIGKWENGYHACIEDMEKMLASLANLQD